MYSSPRWIHGPGSPRRRSGLAKRGLAQLAKQPHQVRELLLVHGGRDELLPVWASEVVKEIAGTGELVVYPPAGHLLLECADELRELLPDWIARVLDKA